jgi:hypothetical protein
MSPLAIFLLLILVAAVLCFVFAGRAASLSAHSSGRPFKIVITIYAALVFVILGGMVWWFIGTRQWNNRNVPLVQQRRIAHTGYYFARDDELTLSGRPLPTKTSEIETQKRTNQASLPEMQIIRQLLPASPERPVAGGEDLSSGSAEHGFFNQALNPGESLHLRPIWEGDRATRWKVSFNSTSRPLRFISFENNQLVSRCVNIPEQRWLDGNETLFLTLQKQDGLHFVAIKWTVKSSWSPFNKTKNAYYYSQGIFDDNGVMNEKFHDLLMSEVMLDEGIGLTDLITRGKSDFRKQVGTIDGEWWDVFDGLTLVRERRGDRDSRVGALIAEDLLQRPDLKIYKSSADGNKLVLAAQDTRLSVEIASTTIMSYGLGYKNTLTLRLSDEVVNDEIWGETMIVTLVRPQSWPLPPAPTKDFIITTSNDYIPLDGYFVDIGDSPHSFYAKAKLNDALDTLIINDGKNVESENNVKQTPNTDSNEFARKFSLDSAASLGDFSQGILLTLVQARPAVPYVGSMALGLIFLNVALFVIVLWKQKKDRPRLYLAWTLIWSLLLAILSVRLILSYRVSLLPPFDATEREIQNVFHKGLRYSLWGLGVCALIVIIVHPLAALWSYLNEQAAFSRLRDSRGFNLMVAVMLGAAIILWIIVGTIFGSNQSFFGVRINIMTHLLIMFGFALLAKQVMDDWLPRVVLVTGVLIALVLQIVVVGDAGVVIYALSLFISLWLLIFWNDISILTRKRPRQMASILIPLVPLIMVLAIIFVPRVVLPYLTQSAFIRSAVRPALPTTAFYRFASFTNAEEAILTSRSTEEGTNVNVLLDNSRQDWQMLLYASHGANNYKGYGQSPLSRRGMTYATSMADCAFAVYLLSEHGKAASLFFLMLYLALGCVCLFAGWYLPRDFQHRNFPLLAIGAFFVCNALYMAGANVGLMVFTGQNIPLLGLYSGTDLLQGLTLVILAGCLLLATETDTDSKSIRSNHPLAFWMALTLSLGLAFWTGLIGWQMAAVGTVEKFRDDHNFSKETFARIKANLPLNSNETDKKQNTPWILQGDKLIRRPGSRVEEIEEQYAKQFDERTDKFNPDGGLYYLERAFNENGAPTVRVKVNDHYFLARSPFHDSTMWRGMIVASGDKAPMLCALGGTLTVTLEEKGYPGSVDLKRTLPVRATSAVLFKDGSDQFCELKRAGENLRLDPKSYQDKWSIFVDGKKITSAIDLQPLSIIVIESKASKFRRNLIYLGPTEPILAYVRWRNGEQRRMFPEASFQLAYLMGKAGDAAFQMEQNLSASEHKIGEKLSLNIDISLQGELQRELVRYARLNSNYSPYHSRPNRLAVTVLDPFTGKVLALPSWPFFNPSNPEYESLSNRLPESNRMRFVYNHNLTNHVAGSTIKPVVFATVAMALQPARFELANLIVHNRADSYTPQPSETPPVHPHITLGKIKMDMWDCNSSVPVMDMRDFLIHSRDFPVGVIGMIGMLMDPKDINKVLVPTSNPSPDITYEGRDFVFDLTKVSENATAFSLRDQFEGGIPSTRGPEALNNTLLFKGLSQQFDFNYQDQNDAWVRLTSARFLPTFDNQKIPVEKNIYLDNIIPASIALAGGDFQDIRGGLLSCLLGGGDCGFNNVKLAEAGARLATGQRVFAQLENVPTATVTMPAPLGRSNWRVANIITPMEFVGEEGTGQSLSGRIDLPPQYKAIYKTGTILEGNGNRESEALMFVIGRWENDGFVKSESLAGFLYMERSKNKNRQAADGDMKKFELAAPLLNAIVKHLRNKGR